MYKRNGVSIEEVYLVVERRVLEEYVYVIV